MGVSTSFVSLDELPTNCAIVIQTQPRPDGELWLRFRAKRPRRWRWRLRASAWSGWFRFEGEPIVLRWATFWES